MNPGYVYFLNAEGTNRYKIGLTVDLDRRMKELNGKQAAFPVKCLWAIEVSDMNDAEKWLHDACANYRVHGEWFEFGSQDLPRVQSLYGRAEEMFSFSDPVRHSAPSRRISNRSSLPWEAIAAGAVLVAGFIGMAVSSGSSQRTAIVQGLTNVRKVPNGQVICTVPSGKKISVVDSGNPQWLRTSDACPQQEAGVIFRRRVKEDL